MMGMNGTNGEAVAHDSSMLSAESCQAFSCADVPHELLVSEGSTSKYEGLSGSTGQYEGLTPLYKRLPHGPHGLGREAVTRHQRARLYGGMAESVYQRGYAATSVADVIALAGVSRRAFYEQFSNKEACFLATYDAFVAASRKRILRAWLSERGWANRLYEACR